MALANWTDAQVLNQLDSGYKWSGSTITYSFATTASGMYASSGESGFSSLNAAAQADAALALSLWDDLMAPDMLQVAAGTTSSASNIEFGLATGGVGYAHAYYPSAGSVWFNSTYNSGTNNLVDPIIGRHGFMTYVHEIGHSLGLDHMGNYDTSSQPSSYEDSTVLSVMSYYGPNWGTTASAGAGLVAWADWVGSDGITYAPQTPMVNDIVAIQAIYGVETTTRAGNTTYGFNSNVTGAVAAIFDFTQNLHPILTIFDSAGVDTIDLSGWSTASIINLAPGSYSSANAMTNNIAIARTATIENAVGGSGADTLAGNDVANVLNGGGGNDTLDGGLGDDTLIGGGGSDTINGGGGNDTVVFSGSWGSYSFTYNSSSVTYTISGGVDGTDTVTNVEFFQFTNATYSAEELLTGASLPSVSIAAQSSSTVEGDSGTHVVSFTVSLDTASTVATSVNWSVSHVSTTTADLSGALSGTVTFAAGETSKTIQVSVSGDSFAEGNEQFNVVLSSPTSGLKLGTQTAGVTIVNDDGAVPADDYANSTATTGVVVIGGVASNGVIETQADSDMLKVDLIAGKTYVFNMNGVESRFNSYVELVNANGVVLQSNNDVDGSTLDSRLTYMAAASGTYYLRASSLDGELGHYSVTAEALPYNLFTGTDLANVITGTVAEDRMLGLAGNDTLTALAGNDVLDGGLGGDTMTGGDGDDIYYVDSTSDRVTEGALAGSGIDTVITNLVAYTLGANVENLEFSGAANFAGTGNTLANTLRGGTGNDTLNGAAGADLMLGGLGSDTYLVDNLLDVVDETGGDGSDTVRSTISFNLASSGVVGAVENLVLLGTAALSGTGNDLDNVITGNTGANILSGNGGNDTLNGLAGADVMIGGTGNDNYFVDNAGDVVDETGGDGVDTVTSTVSFNLSDALRAKGDIENLILTGTTALAGTGNALDNVITGNAGVNVLAGLGGADQLNGGLGLDTASYLASLAGVSVSLAAGTATGGDAAGDSFTSIENLTGSNLDDVLEGDAGNNVLSGGLNGLPGDTVSYDTAGSAVTVSLAITRAQNTLGAGTDTLTGFENVQGSHFNDTLTGNTLANTLWGGDGNDTLTGGAGADSLYGGIGDDTYVVDSLLDVVNETGGDGTDTVRAGISYDLGSANVIGGVENLVLTRTGAINGTGSDLNNVITGNNGANILTGNGGNDTLLGGSGNDTLVGGTGNDTLIGGVGADVLTGGDDSDQFVFLSAAEIGKNIPHDRITDFVSGVDVIDLSGIDANSVLVGDQGFTFIDGAAFSAAGQVRFDAVNHTLSGDVNGDKIADFVLTLDSVNSLTFNDFVL